MKVKNGMCYRDKQAGKQRNADDFRFDDFLAAGRLEDLRSVVRLLESVATRPGVKTVVPSSP